MPTLVLKLLFGTILPTQSPFLVRPLVKMICGSVNGGFIDPDLKSKISFAGAELDKKGGGAAWFAGGDKDGNPVSSQRCTARRCALLPSVPLLIPRLRRPPTTRCSSRSRRASWAAARR